MKALELSEKFFLEKALPAIRTEYPNLKFAAGLAGNGSECFGFDDEISKDHDWGIDFFIWLSEKDADYKKPLSKLKYSLLSCEPAARVKTKYGAGIGVQTAAEFYSSLIGCPGIPQSLEDWIKAPEENYSMAVNGKLFIDDEDLFTNIREGLLGYYPEDIRLKRLAFSCMMMAQTGQYNLLRMAKREDLVTVNECRSRFTENAIHAVFLLNKKYMPYYKWRYKAMTELEILGNECGSLLIRLAKSYDATEMKQICEDVCLLIAKELVKQGLSESNESFMVPHGESVHGKISDPWLKSLPINYYI